MLYKWTIVIVLFIVLCFTPVIGFGQHQIDEANYGRLLEYMEKRASDPGGNTPSGPGTTYYFAENGDDSRNCQDPSEPCQSPDRAIRLVSPGDTVLYKRGSVWSDQSWMERIPQGTEDAFITF